MAEAQMSIPLIDERKFVEGFFYLLICKYILNKALALLWFLAYNMTPFPAWSEKNNIVAQTM